MNLQVCENVATVLALFGSFVGAALAAYQSRRAHLQGVKNGNDIADLVTSLEPLTRTAGDEQPPTH